MYFRGMSDWSVAELEDIDWNVFGGSDDHIVPHQGDDLFTGSFVLNDVHKKLDNKVKKVVGKNMPSSGSVTKTVLWGKQDAYHPSTKDGNSSMIGRSPSHTSNIVVPTLCDAVSINTTLPSLDGTMLDHCVNGYTSNKSNMFCSEDPNARTRTIPNDNKSCLSSVNGVSPDVADLAFMESEQKDRGTDLVYYDWPDVSNFEDIDKMFRNWDSIGQGEAGIADELSWFSSSNTVYGSEIAYEAGFQSSSSDFGTDTPCKGRTTDKKQTCDGGNKKHNAGLTRISTERSLNRNRSADTKHAENRPSSEGKGTKRSSAQMLSDSDVSAPQTYCFQKVSQERHFTGSSGYMHNLDPQSQLEFGLPSQQVPLTQISSSDVTNQSSSNTTVNHCNKGLEKLPDDIYMPPVMAEIENMETLCQQKHFCSPMVSGYLNLQPSLQSKDSVRKKPLGTEMGNVDLEHLTIEADHPTEQESSGITSFPSDLSENVVSFWHLQGLMHQLDVRTKLCMRDSLYRLARSAGQRQGFNTQNFGKYATDAEGIQCMEASKGKMMEFMDAETNTNPVDRSIARLLFHRPSECRSLESRVLVPAATADQVLILNRSNQQRIFDVSTDTEVGSA